MFEKDAEEYANKGLAEKYKTIEWYSRKNDFQKGAEFGYNKAKEELEEKYKETLCNSELNLASVTQQLEELEKANEWHYVKDGLPTNTGLYLIFYYNSFFNDKVRCIARYSPDRKEFLNLNIEDGDEVIAWCEIPTFDKE